MHFPLSSVFIFPQTYLHFLPSRHLTDLVAALADLDLAAGGGLGGLLEQLALLLGLLEAAALLLELALLLLLLFPQAALILHLFGGGQSLLLLGPETLPAGTGRFRPVQEAP